MTKKEIMEAAPMTEKDIIAAVHELPEAQQCYLTRYLLVEHLVKHGQHAVDDILPSKPWVKWVWGAAAAVLSAVATASLTSCTVSPAQLQSAHALYHATTGKPCIIHVTPEK